MLQDIEPYRFNNEFNNKTVENSDYVIIFKNDEILMDNIGGQAKIPQFSKVKDMISSPIESLIYLFSIDESSFYLCPDVLAETSDLYYKSIQEVRETLSKYIVFVIATAKHLAQWYENNRYCGKCASPMVRSKNERALCCDACKITKYPNISPAVIVGIIDKDKDRILLTRYSDRPYTKLALVAGYTEIGETLENTVKREVMEEVGLKVKNIKYFKSQPWAFSQSILMGFFADLEGSSEVNIDTDELSEAIWFPREEVPAPDSTMSLTGEMIEAFRTGKVLVSP